MNLLLNTLIVAELLGLVYSACNVCTCQKTAAVGSEAQFDSDISKADDSEIRTFVAVTSQTITDCQLQLNCDYGDLSQSFDPRAVVVTVGGKQSKSSSLDDVTCVDSKWMYQSEEVKYVACYRSVPNETDL